MREPWLDDGDVRVWHGDAREALRNLPDESVQCIVTSPPFWGLRDYATGKWEGGDGACDHLKKSGGTGRSTLGVASGGNAMSAEAQVRATTRSFVPYAQECGKCGARRVDDQIGNEETPEGWIANLVLVFRECRRVLRRDGVCWIEVGSSYYGGPDSRFSFTPVEAAYLAGIIDGEGCIQVHTQSREGSVDSFQVDVSVGMKPRDVCAWCHETTGIGSLNQRKRSSDSGDWDYWDWSVRGQQATDLLRALYPYLRLKRRQAALVIELAEDVVERRGHRVRPIGEDVIAWRREIRQAVSNLNQYREPGREIREPAPAPPLGLKAKDDVGAPWMLAFALRADGWWLRAENIWYKRNPMPESVTDRTTRAHSQVFLLSKAATYFYDADAIAEEGQDWSVGGPGEGILTTEHYGAENGGNDGLAKLAARYKAGEGPTKRNARSVWEMATANTKVSHFAVMPDELAEKCIKAGTSEHGCCGECGAPWRRVVEKGEPELRAWSAAGAAAYDDAEGGMVPRGLETGSTLKHGVPRTTTGWVPTCEHADAGVVPCVVLDPFMGSGTTAFVARKLSRRSVGVELSAEYLALMKERLKQPNLLTWRADADDRERAVEAE